MPDRLLAPAVAPSIAPAAARRVVLTAAAERRMGRRPWLAARLPEVLAAPDSVEETSDGAVRFTKAFDRRRVSVKVRFDRRRRDLIDEAVPADGRALVVAVEQFRA